MQEAPPAVAVELDEIRTDLDAMKHVATVRQREMDARVMLIERDHKSLGQIIPAFVQHIADVEKRVSELSLLVVAWALLQVVLTTGGCS